jgi:4-hydroxy-2-oxoheptanedioate aldolase
MVTNALKARLKEGEHVFGCFTKHPSASIVELLSLQGWDLIVIDAEHGPIDPLDCERMTRAVELGGATPIVRVPANDRATILRYLDVGPQGLHVPMIESRADAEQVVRFAKYMPDGERGLSGVRAASYGSREGLNEYVRRANAELLIVVQIESKEALEHLDEIVAVPAVDVVFVGPTDLAHSLGVVGQGDHPLVRAALDEVSTAVADSSKAFGILVNNERDAHDWMERGAQYLCLNIENLLRQASSGFLNDVRTQ